MSAAAYDVAEEPSQTQLFRYKIIEILSKNKSV